METNEQTKTMETKVKNKPGRPLVDDGTGKMIVLKHEWFKDVPAFQWANHTDREIADKIKTEVGGRTYHPSVVAVFNKRRAMIGDGKKVACKKPKFTRSKTIIQAQKTRALAKSK